MNGKGCGELDEESNNEARAGIDKDGQLHVHRNAKGEDHEERVFCTTAHDSKDDVDDDAGNNGDFNGGDRNDNNNVDKEDNGCLDGSNDSIARAGRSVHTIEENNLGENLNFQRREDIDIVLSTTAVTTSDQI